MPACHGVQHARRGQRAGVQQRRFRRYQRVTVLRPAVCCIERSGNRRALGQHFGAPAGQRHFASGSLEQQAGLAPTRRRLVLVVLELGNFLWVVGRAVAEQAMQQEDIQKTHGRGVDAHRLERVEVHQAHFNIFNPALAQRMQGPLPGVNHPFRPDGAIELVFNLQQCGAKLVVIAAGVLGAHRFVGRVRPGQRVLERGTITVQTVVADRQRRLCITLVTQSPHAQRGAVRHVHGTAGERLQLMRTPRDKAGAHGGRCAKQVKQQECMAAEITDQRKVLLTADIRQ